MDSRVSEFIDDYYYRSDTTRIKKRMVRAKQDAMELVTLLRRSFPAVSDPVVTDYGKCVEVRAYFDELAPRLGAGWRAVSKYVQRTGRPVWTLGVYLSWVGPYARVALGSESIGPRGEVVVNQSGTDLEKEAKKAHVETEVRSLGYELLTEADFREPISVDPKRMQEMDGTYDPPTTIGKCLFYPWWGGPDMRIDNAR